MDGIYLCKKELEAMNGIPNLQSILYIKGLRPYMDFKTGIVGQVRGISWQSLREALYVEPAAGIVGSGSPSRQQVRTAANGLMRVGLITSMSIGKQLIFKCVLAETDITKKNKVNTKSTREVNTLKPNTVARSSYKVNTPKTGEVNTPPSVRDLKTSTSSESSPLLDDDDKNLIYSKKLSAQEISAINKLLRGFDANTSQMMLDELAGHMAAKQITSPVGYFRAIVRDAKTGIFQPERALKVVQGRKNELARKKQMENSAASVTKSTTLSDAKKPREAKFSISEKLKDLNRLAS